MLSIGEFSKICAVSTKALRHYDGIGLIKPIHVNEENGYRYYDIAQLDDMLLIGRLKRYGFSLQEIDKILKAHDRQYLSACLAAQRILLSRQMQQQQEALSELDDYLQSMERMDSVMKINEIELVTTTDTPIVSVRQHMSSDDYGKYFGMLHERLAKDGIAPVVHLSIYHDSEYSPDNTDIEVGIAIADSTKADRVLKGGLAAHLTHKGSYATLNESYVSLMQWAEKNGYAVSAPPYEKYITGPECGKPASEWVTEVYFPVEKK